MFGLDPEHSLLFMFQSSDEHQLSLLSHWPLYYQDLGKVALAHTSEVRPCGHFSRQDRVLCFLQAVVQKPALGENYRGPHQKHRLPDLLEDTADQRSEGKQLLAKYNTSSK